LFSDIKRGTCSEGAQNMALSRILSSKRDEVMVGENSMRRFIFFTLLQV
jgi:hypothetical protein